MRLKAFILASAIASLSSAAFAHGPSSTARYIANEAILVSHAYAGIDAVFISHAHRDHFSAAAMIAYLSARPEVKLVAPQQALDMMKADANWDAALRGRMTILDMEAGDEAETISVGDVKASAVRIIHMGDADPRRQHFIPHRDHWAAKRTDHAFPPYWFLTSPSKNGEMREIGE